MFSKNCSAFPRDILRNAFVRCGIVSSDSRTFNNQLRNFGQNRTLTDGIDVYQYPSEELRERQPKLMHSGENLIDLSSVDEDDDYE